MAAGQRLRAYLSPASLPADRRLRLLGVHAPDAVPEWVTARSAASGTRMQASLPDCLLSLRLGTLAT